MQIEFPNSLSTTSNMLFALVTMQICPSSENERALTAKWSVQIIVKYLR